MGKKQDGQEGTRQVRVNGDLADMIGWLVRVEGGTSAELLDPILRAPISARFKRIEPAVEAIKKANDVARRAEEAELRKLSKKTPE